MASVRVENTALKDPRIAYLGVLMGTNIYGAVGHMVGIWEYCTEHDTYIAPLAAVKGIFGRQGVEWLLEAELAEETDEGLRVKGTQGRIEWLRKKREAAAKGGRAKQMHSSARASVKQNPSGARASVKQTQSNRLAKGSGLPIPACPPAPAPAHVHVQEESVSSPTKAGGPTNKPKPYDWIDVYDAYPLKKGKKPGLAKLKKLKPPRLKVFLAATEMRRLWEGETDKTFCPHFSTWVSRQAWEDDEQQGPSKEPATRRFDTGPTAEDVAERARQLEAMGL